MLLEDLHNNIIEQIAENFKGVLHEVIAYPYLQESITTPACFIEMNDLEPSEKRPATGQTHLEANFSAELIIGFNEETGSVHQRVFLANLAAEFARFIQDNRFGLKVGEAELISVTPDDFSPEWNGYFTWKIEWKNSIYIGTDFWDTPENVLKILVSTAPNIGTKHKDEYKEVAP